MDIFSQAEIITNDKKNLLDHVNNENIWQNSYWFYNHHVHNKGHLELTPCITLNSQNYTVLNQPNDAYVCDTVSLIIKYNFLNKCSRAGRATPTYFGIIF